MKTEKVRFSNAQGFQLSARLEFPVDQDPQAFAVFAHCFTCNKNLSAVRNISRALTSRGFGLLRFDFTGLGESEGDFSDSNFSSNVGDLVAAAGFLEEHYEAPKLMIGHSLGGAAVVFAASKVEAVQAVATIGAPSDPEHVKRLLKDDLETLEEEGEAEVFIGGRPFKVKKQFLEDLLQKDMRQVLRNLRKSVLIMHSPQDQIVDIENAARIYEAAFHPKSFVSLDGADHLLSEKEDSIYAGAMIASWSERYIDLKEKDPLKTHRQVVAQLGSEGFTTEIRAGRHGLIADEPESAGGSDYGPSPYGLLSASLAACTVMTLQMYARRKKWDLQEVTVHIDHAKDHKADCEDCENAKSRIDHFHRELELEGELDESQRQRLLEIAEKCPVHRTLHGDVVIQTTLK